MFRVTRTPFRISFLGGGSDYPAWYNQHIGMVLGAAINKYCYITYQDGQEKFRLLYSKLEECNSLEEIKHPAIRETLRYTGKPRPSSVTHASDFPSRSGVGSSSAFVIGLLAATKGGCWDCLAKDAIDIEQNVLKEPVGSQDQILCAKGGINQIVFHPTGYRGVRSIEMAPERLGEFHDHLMMFYTGPRPYSVPEPLQYDVKTVQRLAHMAKEGTDLLLSNRDIRGFGELLHEGWVLKKQMSNSITTPYAELLYNRAKAAGAIGGKLLGAGGGGFMLLFAEPRYQQQIRGCTELIQVPFKFDFQGSRVIYAG